MSSNNSIIRGVKVALVHDYIKEYGGAERVLEALHEIWPEAPVFTTVYLPEFLGPHRERFKGWDIRTSWVQYLPFKAKLISPLRLLAPFLFKTFNFSQFDVVIVSATGAYSPNSMVCHPEFSSGSKVLGNEKEMLKQVQHDKKKKPLHLCYCHTPPRYLYGYMTAREWKRIGVVRVVGEVMNHFLRLIDFKSAQNVDYFIANSEEVKSRIKKFYRREARVVYPPVDIGFQNTQNTQQIRKSDASDNQKVRPPEFSESSGNYYLAGGRLARAKGIDIIIEAFAKLKKPLKIFGKGFAGYEKELKSAIQNSRVEFLGEVSDEEKVELMQNAKAYVFASFDEDFGITPVEAMGVGTPVIAYRSGGVLESVVDGKTGIFYRFNDLNHLSEAIHKFEKIKFDREEIAKYAQKFSKERFKKEIKKFVISTTYKNKKKV